MRVDFDALARAKSDEELKAMVEREQHEWSQDALTAARAEMDARGVTYVEPDPSADPPEPPPKETEPPNRRQQLSATIGVLLLAAGVLTLLQGGVNMQSLCCLVPGGALAAYAFSRA